MFSRLPAALGVLLFLFSVGVEGCLKPNVPENGYIIRSPRTTSGSEEDSSVLMMFGARDFVTIKCHSGFELVGDQVLVCLPSGIWKGTIPVCKDNRKHKKLCRRLEDPIHGYVSLSSGLAVGSWAKYTCDNGYTLIGLTAIRTCLSTGEWTGSEPTCERGTSSGCIVPVPPENGEVLYRFIKGMGEVAIYSCKMNFELEGDTIRWCLSGHWIGPEPTCRKINQPCASANMILWAENEPNLIMDNCPIRVSKLIFGRNKVISYLNTKDHLVILPTNINTGELNFHLVDHFWLERAHYHNVIRKCRHLKRPRNGRLIIKGTHIGSQAMYRCKRGFILRGSRKRTCRCDGRWSGITPTCLFRK